MKVQTLIRTGAVALLSAVMAVAQTPTAKIHGHVTDPTGVPKGVGTVSLSTDGGHTLKYSFPVNSAGDYTGDGIAPGTYMVVLRLPDTAEGKLVDHIDNVKIAAGEDIKQDVDMSRQAYIDQLNPEQKKQVEEYKKKNAEVLKGNQVIKNLNADLAEARQDNKDKKFTDAEALMQKDIALKQDSELLWYELGMSQMGQKKWDDATTSFKKAADLGAAAKKPNPELIGGAQAALGEVDARNNKPADAATEYDLAAKSNPPKAGFYYANETVVFFNVGNSDAQAAAADKAIAADPSNPLPYYLKGQALAGKITVDPKSGAYITPPGMVEAYNKYLQLAPTGQYAGDVKALLAATQTKVDNKYKAKKSGS